MSIILLRGFSNSGKDFVGNILCKQYNYKRFAFADSLKKLVAESTNCSIDLLHSQQGKLSICHSDTLKRTYRQILIDEALRLRNIDPDIFVKHCCQEIIASKLDKIVITDWRYPNELEVIKTIMPSYKVTPVHLIRINQEKSPVDDISEYQLMSRTNDYVLYNNMDDTIYNNINNMINFINS